MHALSSFGMFLGRAALSIVFILAGMGKFMEPDVSSGYMAAKGMTMVPFFLYAAALLEVAGGLCLFVGWKTRFAAAALFLFLIPVTAIFHDFWNADATHAHVQLSFFLKNIAIMGGLLYVASCGAGGCSCDAWCSKR